MLALISPGRKYAVGPGRILRSFSRALAPACLQSSAMLINGSFVSVLPRAALEAGKVLPGRETPIRALSALPHLSRDPVVMFQLSYRLDALDNGLNGLNSLWRR
jgi:hypothetical protein